MHTSIRLDSEHLIYFQAFLSSPALSDFLLCNRLEQVRGLMPKITSVRVIVQGSTTVKPHHITTLACLLEEYRQAKVAISFEDNNSVIYPYLEEIGFLAHWQKADFLDVEPTSLPSDSTFFVLWQVRRDTLDAYATSAYQHYANAFFAGKDLSFLTTYIAELCNNVLDHAFAGTATERIAFAFLQYYPSRKRLFISVSDFGMGIPTSVNRFLASKNREPVLALKAVELALTPNFTAESYPYNRGRGLNIVSAGIELLRGQLAIQTARALYVIVRSGEKKFGTMPDSAFPGTTISITVFYDGLADEEATILDGDTTLF